MPIEVKRGMTRLIHVNLLWAVEKVQILDDQHLSITNLESAYQWLHKDNFGNGEYRKKNNGEASMTVLPYRMRLVSHPLQYRDPSEHCHRA